MKMIEESFKIAPAIAQPKLEQKVVIRVGSFKGMIVKIAFLSSNERVGILLHFLGSMRTANIQ